MFAEPTLPDDRFAVVLNANAGRVTPKLARAIQRTVSPDRVFLTESQEHAREVLHRCVENDVKTVFAGGGDGTIVDTINTLAGYHGQVPELPRVGVLRLGTGNALAHWLGSGAPLRDLARWRSGEPHTDHTVQMVQAEGTLFPFAGVGHDAAVLNDYNWVKERGSGTWWEGLARGMTGYLLAGYLKTVPNYLRRDNPMVTVTNLGSPAWHIGPDGRETGEPVVAGQILYRGPAAMLGCATTPLYGYGMKMYPFATRRPGRFQLRILNMSPLQCAMNFPAAWRGTLQHSGLYDFYADRVRVQFEDAVPYQLGGDARGYRRELTFELARFPVRMVGQA